MSDSPSEIAAQETISRQAFLKHGFNRLLSHAVAILPPLQMFSLSPVITAKTAVIEVTTCTAFQGSGCQVCYTVCPLPEEAIELLEGLPHVLPKGCTGCGICVTDCPTLNAIALMPQA